MSGDLPNVGQNLYGRDRSDAGAEFEFGERQMNKDMPAVGMVKNEDHTKDVLDNFMSLPKQ